MTLRLPHAKVADVNSMRNVHPAEERLVARLRATRKARGLSQAAAASRAGIAEAAVASIETGRRHMRVSEAAHLADAYAVSLADLIADGPYSVPMEDVA